MSSHTVDVPKAAPLPANGQRDAKPVSPEQGVKPYKFTGRVTYASSRQAEMVRATLAVDAELRPLQVTKTLSTDGSDFVMHFEAVDGRSLRAAVGTFCDLLGLATRTLEAFDATDGAPGANGDSVMLESNGA